MTFNRLFALATFVGAFACSSTTSTPSNSNPGTPSNSQDNEAAIAQLADARCGREDRCGNVGTGKKYRTRIACTDDERGKLREDLRSDKCPGGVDSNKLSSCIDTIKKQDCDNPIDSLSTLVNCRSSDLCLLQK